MPRETIKRRFFYRIFDKEFECMDQMKASDEETVSIRNCKICNRVNAFRSNIFPDTYECYYCNPKLWHWAVK